MILIMNRSTVLAALLTLIASLCVLPLCLAESIGKVEGVCTVEKDRWNDLDSVVTEAQKKPLSNIERTGALLPGSTYVVHNGKHTLVLAKSIKSCSIYVYDKEGVCIASDNIDITSSIDGILAIKDEYLIHFNESVYIVSPTRIPLVTLSESLSDQANKRTLSYKRGIDGSNYCISFNEQRIFEVLGLIKNENGITLSLSPLPKTESMPKLGLRGAYVFTHDAVMVVGIDNVWLLKPNEKMVYALPRIALADGAPHTSHMVQIPSQPYALCLRVRKEQRLLYELEKYHLADQTFEPIMDDQQMRFLFPRSDLRDYIYASPDGKGILAIFPHKLVHFSLDGEIFKTVNLSCKSIQVDVCGLKAMILLDNARLCEYDFTLGVFKEICVVGESKSAMYIDHKNQRIIEVINGTNARVEITSFDGGRTVEKQIEGNLVLTQYFNEKLYCICGVDNKYNIRIVSLDENYDISVNCMQNYFEKYPSSMAVNAKGILIFSHASEIEYAVTLLSHKGDVLQTGYVDIREADNNDLVFSEAGYFSCANTLLPGLSIIRMHYFRKDGGSMPISHESLSGQFDDGIVGEYPDLLVCQGTLYLHSKSDFKWAMINKGKFNYRIDGVFSIAQKDDRMYAFVRAFKGEGKRNNGGFLVNIDINKRIITSAYSVNTEPFTPKLFFISAGKSNYILEPLRCSRRAMVYTLNEEE